MTEQEISVKLTETEQRAKSNTHRIEKLEQQQKDLNKLVTAVEVLASREKGVETDVKEIKADVKTITQKGGKRWDAMIDRVLYGYVVDFLQFHWSWLSPVFPGGFFPAFNIADSAITVGATALILDELLRVRRGR